MNGPVYLHYDLSVLGQNNVLQRVLHQQGEIHLIHGHVRQRGLLQRDEDIGDEINVINGRKKKCNGTCLCMFATSKIWSCCSAIVYMRPTVDIKKVCVAC